MRKVARYFAISAAALIASFLYLSSLSLTPPDVSANSGSVVSTTVNTAIAVTLTPQNSLSIPITPNASSAYSTRKLSINVATNNPTGYTMTMSAGNDGNALTNPSASINNTLPTTTGTVAAPTSLNLNTWGYAIPTTQPNPAGLLPNDTSGFDAAYSEVTSIGSLAAKYAAMPINTSPLTIKSTAVSSNADNTDLYVGARVDTTKPAGNYYGTIIFSIVPNYVPPEQPTSMQTMTAAYCDSMSEGDIINLTDTRDGNAYDVAKIGSRCWMAQNLALGDSSEITLTPNDSNVASNWTLPAHISNGTASNNTSAQWIDATTDALGMSYCVHSAQCGNLYNWFAATAGTGTTSLSSGNAPSSICPAGWYLPTGGENTSTDFAQLDIALGGIGSYQDTDTSYLSNAPWSAVLSGLYYYGLFGQGDYGYYWSSTAYSSGYAYLLYFDPSYVYPGDDYYDSVIGLAVRCVLNT